MNFVDHPVILSLYGMKSLEWVTGSRHLWHSQIEEGYMKILTIDPRNDVRWNVLLEKHASDVFHSVAWINAVSETYEFPVQAYLLVDDAGEPEAGLPFCAIDDLRGKRVVSFPFSDYYDPLVANECHWQLLSAALLQPQFLVKVRCLHNPIPVQDSRFRLANKARWHGLTLPTDLDYFWQKQIDKKDRWAMRKAEQAGVVIRPARDTSELRKFYEMHLNMRKYKYHMVAQPYHFFENIWRQFVEPGHGILFVAEYQNQLIAATLFLHWQDKFYYKFNTSRREFLSLAPNDLLIWAGIQYAQAQGCYALDFGLSDWDQEGLIHFKRKYASEEKTIFFLEHTPPLILNQPQSQANELLPALTKLFTDPSVPDAITEKAGALLYRLFV